MDATKVVLLKDVDGRTVVVGRDEFANAMTEQCALIFGTDLNTIAAFLKGWYKLKERTPEAMEVLMFFDKLHEGAKMANLIKSSNAILNIDRTEYIRKLTRTDGSYALEFRYQNHVIELLYATKALRDSMWDKLMDLYNPFDLGGELYGYDVRPLKEKLGEDKGENI